MPTLSISTYIYAGIAIIIVVLLGYCKVLSSEKTALQAVNITLTGQVSQLSQVVKDKTNALQICSDNTISLKKKDEEITSNAKSAVEAAQKKSKISYSIAAKLIKSQTVVPTINSTNVQYYGGPDQAKKLADCDAAHQLFNDEIDRRAAAGVTQ